ncbi:MAG: lipopolysaccharide heptosyltransferase II [Candidatus Omnitrophica bacterium]|nr:lipopolysaccharide heptosyltransferase II [Candidatus Omnitrophota bacterium]
MNNILVVNVNWLGDAIFSTPVFKALKKAYPNAHVSCLAVPRVKDVLNNCPFIDEVLVYDEKGKHFYPWAKLNMILELRGKKFDAAFMLHRSMTRALLVYLAGIPQRIGYGTKKQSHFLTQTVVLESPDLHRSDEYLKVVEGFGVPVDDRACELNVSAERSSAVEQKLAASGIKSGDSLVVVNTGGNWDLKRWPAEYFSRLIARLVQETGVKILIPGAPSDKELVGRIARDSGVDPVVWAGETSLEELFALFKRADVVISNDSGPLHVAAAVGTDTIALFGPTRPEITGPRGRGRAVVLHKEIGCNKTPCYHLGCLQNECMRVITVDDVFKAYQKLRS